MKPRPTSSPAKSDFTAAENIVRGGHASLNRTSRHSKARKIEILLDLPQRSQPFRLLEIGTGSGWIAHYFSHHPELRCEVDSVDIADNRQTQEGYQFTQVADAAVPFPDEHFDVVISNHVIEHVGDDDAQLLHLAEMHRVLKNDGIGYLAAPNRWQWIEPHYRLAGLSWLPERWRSHYLRLRGRGAYYDCRPLTAAHTEVLLSRAGFAFEQQHGRALRLTYELERPHSAAYRLLFRKLPDGIYAAARRAFPTLIYVLRPLR